MTEKETSLIAVADPPTPVPSDLIEVDNIPRDAEPIDALPSTEDDSFPMADDAYALSSSQEEISEETLRLSDDIEFPVATEPQDDDWRYPLEQIDIASGSSVSDEYVPGKEDSDFSVSAQPSYTQLDVRGSPLESELDGEGPSIEESPSEDIDFSDVVLHSGVEEDFIDAQPSEISPPAVTAALADESGDRVIVASVVSFEDDEEMMDESASATLKAVSRTSDDEISTEPVTSPPPEDAVDDVADTEVDFAPEPSIHRATESGTEIEEALFDGASPPSDASMSSIAPLSGEVPEDTRSDRTEEPSYEDPVPSSVQTHAEETTDVVATTVEESDATSHSPVTEIVSSSPTGSTSQRISDASTRAHHEKRRHFRHTSLVSEMGANSSSWWSQRMTTTSDGRHDLSNKENPSGFLHRSPWFYVGWGVCLSIVLLAAVSVVFYVYRRRKKRQYVTPQCVVQISDEESSSDGDSIVPDMDLPTGRTDTDQLLDEEDIDKRQQTASERRDLDSASGRSPRSPRRLRFSGVRFSFKSVEAIRGSEILVGPLSYISSVVEHIREFVLTRARKRDDGRDGLKS